MNVIMIRNCKIYFRNKRGVLSSLISALIVIVLYVFFLGNNLEKSFSNLPNIDYLINSWVMAGFISVASVTTTLGAISIMIRDKENGKIKDFLCSPIKPRQMAGGYLLSSYIIGVVMSVFTLIISEIYIVARGGHLLSVPSVIELFLTILLTVLASSAMMFFIINLFRSSDTFSTAASIIAPLSGFLTGVYIPIGVLPPALQTVIQIFPLTHGAALIRQIMMKDAMKEAFANSASAEALNQFKQYMGVTLQVGSISDSLWLHIAILFATAVVFYGLSTLVLAKKRKTF